MIPAVVFNGDSGAVKDIAASPDRAMFIIERIEAADNFTSANAYWCAERIHARLVRKARALGNELISPADGDIPAEAVTAA